MSNEIGSYVYDNLSAGDYPVVTSSETILSGVGALARGSVLGRVTASGKLVLVNSAGTDDGRRTPYGILLEAVDATSADKPAAVALSGEFNSAKLVFGGSDTAATHKAALRDLNIYVKTNVAAVIA